MIDQYIKEGFTTEGWRSLNTLCVIGQYIEVGFARERWRSIVVSEYTVCDGSIYWVGFCQRRLEINSDY